MCYNTSRGDSDGTDGLRPVHLRSRVRPCSPVSEKGPGPDLASASSPRTEEVLQEEQSGSDAAPASERGMVAMYNPNRNFVVDLTVSSTTDRVILTTIAVVRFTWEMIKNGAKVLLGLGTVWVVTVLVFSL